MIANRDRLQERVKEISAVSIPWWWGMTIKVIEITAHNYLNNNIYIYFLSSKITGAIKDFGTVEDNLFINLTTLSNKNVTLAFLISSINS